MISTVPIVLHPAGVALEAVIGTPLREILFERGVEFPCGGRGHCGACRVRVLEGQLPPTDSDRRHFPSSELQQGWRLACGHQVFGPLVLDLAQWDIPILTGHRPFSFSPRQGLGIAIDLGTTTLVAQLLCLQSGETLAVETAMNPQGLWGADIMSRIHAALYDRQGEALCRSIRSLLGQMIDSLLASAKAAHREESCSQVFLVGNTVMHHLFSAYSVAPLASYPFESPDLGPSPFSAEELGWRALPGDTPICFLPCLGGFVGSDILAGILALDIQESQEPQLLVDLGTNGEIVVGDRHKIYCASTAAGPAFEGGRISCGMRAASGAVDQVWLQESEIQYHVIGGGTPRGLCGSGLTDMVAVGLECGKILPHGRFAAGSGEFLLAPAVTLTQKDVRELQLAKAAIAAGVRLLLHRAGREIGDIAKIHLAGAFGNYINPRSAQKIGLLPYPEDCIEPVGNTALLGAKRFLFSTDAQAEWQKILRNTEHVSLADDPLFQDVYTDEMMFS